MALVAALCGCAGGNDISAPRSPTPLPEPSEPLGSTSAPPAAPDPARAAVEALLRRRAEAVVARDRAAFLRTTDEAHRALQVDWFRRMSRVPVESFRFELGTGQSGRSATGPVYEADVDAWTRLRGFDPAPVWTTRHLRFAKERGAWRVTQDRVDPSQILSAPWEMPGIAIRRSGRVLLAADASSLAQAQGLVDELERARAFVDAETPRGLGHVVCLALSTEGALRAEGLNADELSRVGAVTAGVRGADFEVTEQRVIVAPSSLSADPAWVRVMLRHELVHVALASYADTSPTWLTEGIADYVAHRGEQPRLGWRAVIAARQHDMTMPPNGLFYRGDDGDNSTNYAVAWWSLEYLATIRGEDEPFRLLEAFRRHRDSAGFDEMSELLRRRYGLTADQLAAHAAQLIVDRWRGVLVMP